MKFEDQIVERYPGPFSMGPHKIINVICADGVQRNAFCSNKGADTFFTIPAYVHVKGKKVYGYVTQETIGGFTTEFPDDHAVYKFVVYTYTSKPLKYGHLLPMGSFRLERDKVTRIPIIRNEYV